MTAASTAISSIFQEVGKEMRQGQRESAPAELALFRSCLDGDLPNDSSLLLIDLPCRKEGWEV